MKISCFLIFILLTIPSIKGQENAIQGLPFIKNYGPDTYQGGIQNWSIVQHENGLLYVANNLGLLEYDGDSWRNYAVKNRTKVRSIYIGKDERVYVGSQRDFGYFAPDEKGELGYFSLADSLENSLRDFDETWKIYGIGDKVYFCTFSEIFIYDGKDIQAVTSDYSLEISFLFENELYTQEWEKGLSKLINGVLSPIPGGEFFKDKRISNIFRYDKDNWLISTFSDGLYMYQDGSLSSMAIDKALDLSQLIVNFATRLSNGLIGLGTQNGGLLVIDQSGQLIYQFDQSSGLKDRTVNFIYEDLQGNLWLTLNNGISRVDLNSGFSRIDDRFNLSGSGYAAKKTSQGVFLGTNNGLYKFDEQRKIYKLVPGTSGQVYSIQELSNRIFIGHHNGPIEIVNGKARFLHTEKGAWVFKQHPNNPDIVLLGTYLGINKFNLRTNEFVKIQGFEESSRVMEFDGNDLWVTQGYKGAFRLTFSPSGDEIESVKLYNSENGFPSDLLINVFKIDDQLIFTSDRGFFQYDTSSDSFTSLMPLNELVGADASIVDMEADEFGDIYFIERNKLGVLKPKGSFSYELLTKSFNKVNNLWNDDLGNISVLDDENILIGAKEGFIHYAPKKDQIKNNNFNVILREIRNAGVEENILNYGHPNLASESSRASFSYKQNSFQFSFAAPHFESDGQISYQYKLDNFQDEWSDWTASNFKEYTNLREGNYSFSIRARNIFDQETDVISYYFRVSPPIHRTTFAYTLYGLTAFLMIFSGFKTVDARHKKKTQAIEDSKNQEIQQRDSKIQDITQKSTDEIVRLRNEKLQTEIGLKSQALTSSAMHLIQKNQLLNQIKNTLKSLNKEQEDKQLVKELSRIVRSIDKDLSTGTQWDQFQSNFDQVHGNFITRLKEAYPGLTPQELRFSAYIRMNLSTKEIANLLNISVRGVEIGRYRVRKKLELKRENNLSDFILRF
ncbi:triple tyrosine motif-containing protein [Roseivirga sp.]|uniref:triple tyrosine motif-containing protein n=1 Tax=Roseivirga sp. TaxID=1964215 RepID=UPI003B8DD468